MTKQTKRRILLLLGILLPLTLSAQKAGIAGRVVDSESGNAIPGVRISLIGQDIQVTSGPSGDFSISNAQAGQDMLTLSVNGYESVEKEIQVFNNQTLDIGIIRLKQTISPYQYDDDGLITFDESLLDDDSGVGQSIGYLSGASDDVYQSTASYAFGATRFRLRGYDSQYTKVYLNGINFNDAARGQFNYSMMGGMNQAFRSKDIVSGTDIANFGFGDIGGATNISTLASEYAPGLRGSLAYTNRSYQWRAMLNYSTGLLPSGWALNFSASTRLGNHGPVEGTFYNSMGYFLSIEKVINKYHSLNLTTFGAPTKRGQSSASFEEAYQLTGDNL